MGLELIVREESSFGYNDKNQQCYTVTEIFNFRNCWSILKNIDTLASANVYSIVTVEASKFYRCYQKIKNPEEKALLKKFIEQEDIIEDDDRLYDVYVSW